MQPILMKSELSPELFYKALNKNVVYGNPNIKGGPANILTIFDSGDRFFFGQYNRREFRLTHNSGLLNSCEFVIQGSYSASDDGGTDLEVKVRPIWLSYLWLRLIPPLGVIAMSIVLVHVAPDHEPGELIALIMLMSAWIGLPWLFLLWRSNKRRKKLEQTFKQYLKIET